MRKVTTMWTCKDGTKLRICDMTDSHLLNAARMLQRKAENEHAADLQAAYSVWPMLQGEMASWECGNAIDRMESDPDGEAYLHPLFEPLCNEIQRRKLTL